MDKESEKNCAKADCKDKKMAKKCMMTCKMCEGGSNGENGGKGKNSLYLFST